MTQTTVPQPGAPAPSLAQRVIGVITSPQSTFERIVAHPKWLDVLALTIVVGAVAWFAFLSTPVGQQAFIDQQLEQQERWGVQITAEVETRTAAQAPMMRFVIPAASLVMGPLFAFAIAGVLYGVFGAMLGGGGSYKQALAVVSHAGVIPTVTGLGGVVLAYFRESMASGTNLGVFVGFLPEESLIARFLGSIDLIWVWYLIILAIGLAVLYRRKAGSIIWTFLGLYSVIALIIAVVRSA